MTSWLDAALRGTADDDATALTRYMVAAAAEDAVVGRRLDEHNHASQALAQRLVRARERGEIAPDADVPAIVEAITGAILLRVLRRAPYTSDAAATLARTILPTTR
ncbi:MAG: TetR/AcrR family transcriptional regulator C-terminal ligand-binding domain-containing protein [Microbacterium sp.]